MRGPFWNENTGVTGEPKTRQPVQPNYVTTTNSEGQPVTLVGEDADRFRSQQA